MGEFGGVRTAIAYGSVIEEHKSVRTSAGVFDLSHMALIDVRGDVANLLQKLLTRDVFSVGEGRMLGPALFLNERGGIKDDIMAYPMSSDRWILVGNAMNLVKNLTWLENNASMMGINVSVRELNSEYALLALQGPSSPKIVSRLNSGLVDLSPMEFKVNVNLGDNARALVASRSGWTGEDGFEFLLVHEDAEKVFSNLVNSGVTPCGLAARDSLRLEMGYYLYGNELGEDVNPIEARYWMSLDLDKVVRGDCIGCDVVSHVLVRGVDRVIVGLRFSKKARLIARKGNHVTVEGEKIGYVTSGSYSPVLDRPIALAFVDSRHALMGLRVLVNVRKKAIKAKIVDFPFISRQ